MEEQILRAFLYKEKLKFSEIEKRVNIRSNKLSYHLKNLVKKNLLQKENDYYVLSETNEKQIPYLSQKKSPLVVVLVAIRKNNNEIFLIKRNKRPFKDKLGLPGGRLYPSESIKDATTRIAKKWNVDVTHQLTHSITLEHATSGEETMHSFVLVLVSGTTNDTLDYTAISEHKSGIIPSDYYLITKHLDKTIEIEEYITPI